MLSIRLVLCVILLLFVQAESYNYIRGEKVNPAGASRIVLSSSQQQQQSNKDEILEFQSVKKVSGSKPVQDTSPKRRRGW